MDGQDIARIIRGSRERLQLNQDTLAQRVSCSGPYITMLEKGRCIPSLEMAVKLERALKLKAGSLLELAIAWRVGSGSPELTRAAMAGAPETDRVEAQSYVPLLSQSPLSATFIARAETEEWVGVPQREIRGRRMYLLRVAGDAMSRANLDDGDVILVDADAPPRHGDLVVARVQGKSLVRRFARTDARVSLIAESAAPIPSLHFPCTPTNVLRGTVEALYLKSLR